MVVRVNGCFEMLLGFGFYVLWNVFYDVDVDWFEVMELFIEDEKFLCFVW